MAWRCLTTLDTGGQDVVKAGRSEQVTSHHPQARAVSIAQDISSHLGRGTYADLLDISCCRAIGLGFGIWYLHIMCEGCKVCTETYQSIYLN